MVDDRGPKVACLKDATCVVRAGLPHCDVRRMGGGEGAVMQAAGRVDGACRHHRSMVGHRRHRGAARVGVTATAGHSLPVMPVMCGFGPFGAGREVSECWAVVSVGGVERSCMICGQTGSCVHFF